MVEANSSKAVPTRSSPGTACYSCNLLLILDLHGQQAARFPVPRLASTEPEPASARRREGPAGSDHDDGRRWRATRTRPDAPCRPTLREHRVGPHPGGDKLRGLGQRPSGGASRQSLLLFAIGESSPCRQMHGTASQKSVVHDSGPPGFRLDRDRNEGAADTVPSASSRQGPGETGSKT